MRTLVVSDNAALGAKLRETFLRDGCECSFAHLGVRDLVCGASSEFQPEVIAVVLSPDPEPALAFLRDVRPRTQGRILAVGPAVEPQLILRALREGADRYLDEADLDVELQSVLHRLRTEQFAQGDPGKLICILGASGGSGASSLAANLSTVLAKEHKSCILLDLKPGADDLATLLDLKPTNSITDLCQNATRMDRVMFERSLVRHESGVHLLASPLLTPADFGRIAADAFAQALSMARALFPYAVADLQDCFHEEQLQALSQADAVLLVLRLDFTSLRRARRLLDQLEEAGVPRQRVQVIANRYGQPKELPYSKAEDALGLKISHYLPDDPKTMNFANNHGVPAVLSSPKASVSKSIQKLAANVNGRPH